MTTTPDLGPAGTALATVVRTVPDDVLDRPTPCAQWALRDLLAHVDGLLLAFRAAADKELGPLTDTAPPETPPALEPGWRDRIPERIDALVAAWQEPSAWTGMTRAGGVDLPGDVAGVVALDELVMHGWDLARAIGAPFTVDDTTAALVHEFATATAAEQSPIFAAARPIPDGADTFTEALALAGRDPAWSAPRPAPRP